MDWGFATQGGLFGVALFIIWRTFEARIGEIRKDRDFYRLIALRGTELADRHVKVTEQELAAKYEETETVMARRMASFEAQLRSLGRHIGHDDED